MRSVFSNCGQVCLCSERVYVERPIFERFVAALAQRARALKIGGPYEDADMGPLISRGHRDKVLGYYRLAREERGEVVTAAAASRSSAMRATAAPSSSRPCSPGCPRRRAA